MVRGRKKVSTAWAHFRPIQKTKRFQCVHCNVEVVGPGCSNLKKHLQARHKAAFSQVDSHDRITYEKGLGQLFPTPSTSPDSSMATDFGDENMGMQFMKLLNNAQMSQSKTMDEPTEEEEANQGRSSMNLMDLLDNNKDSDVTNNVNDLVSSCIISNLTEQCEALKKVLSEKDEVIERLKMVNAKLIFELQKAVQKL
ncbi:unnamed protein product [Bursaphelenchus okinawaensis]|uniref:BED-type domain-containing protein n=1 Tax=Bursaphelenchus okinawaensis TaxID=465554 RepID=A0A811K5N1_9BILA|nr:unnamed protein product [Bursaphelenchus okinawaensis]CAG9091787.1 unnamed protein product [Bursaphelenchus okinawaensis]